MCVCVCLVCCAGTSATQIVGSNDRGACRSLSPYSLSLSASLSRHVSRASSCLSLSLSLSVFLLRVIKVWAKTLEDAISSKLIKKKTIMYYTQIMCACRCDALPRYGRCTVLCVCVCERLSAPLAKAVCNLTSADIRRLLSAVKLTRPQQAARRVRACVRTSAVSFNAAHVHSLVIPLRAETQTWK